MHVLFVCFEHEGYLQISALGDSLGCQCPELSLMESMKVSGTAGSVCRDSICWVESFPVIYFFSSVTDIQLVSNSWLNVPSYDYIHASFSHAALPSLLTD